MGIALDEIGTLEAVLNEKFKKDNLRFKFSIHFVRDRMNDPRNDPAITITELQGIFNRLTTIHLGKLLRLQHNDTFNVRCRRTDINIPCAMSRQPDQSGRSQREVIAITVMRKKDFVSKDEIEFEV
ncbi:hypothetical protein ACXYTJ_06210 [Gilvimarinus sp. F26214L]|uniref:hypothetical protein n=1 Tax=Gilvimarinus sp. DZF01 TaxID=3461371 RepID=UPI004045B1AF